jgi:hypothetical protein
MKSDTQHTHHIVSAQLITIYRFAPLFHLKICIAM